MLQLRYCLDRDIYQFVIVFGDPEGIRNLFWQLTHNYVAQDGMKIGEIVVLNMDGEDVTETILSAPYTNTVPMSKLDH